MNDLWPGLWKGHKTRRVFYGGLFVALMIFSYWLGTLKSSVQPTFAGAAEAAPVAKVSKPLPPPAPAGYVYWRQVTYKSLDGSSHPVFIFIENSKEITFYGAGLDTFFNLTVKAGQQGRLTTNFYDGDIFVAKDPEHIDAGLKMRTTIVPPATKYNQIRISFLAG